MDIYGYRRPAWEKEVGDMDIGDWLGRRRWETWIQEYDLG